VDLDSRRRRFAAEAVRALRREALVDGGDAGVALGERRRRRGDAEEGGGGRARRRGRLRWALKPQGQVLVFGVGVWTAAGWCGRGIDVAA